jgi:yecA family protein
MLLLKQGHGVKDAYVIPCSSATEQRRLLTQVAEEIDPIDVTPEALQPALAAALAEGHETGTPPAHGLVDVAEVCGLREVRPAAMSVEDWVAYLDPAGELSRLSPQKLGRLVNSSADWPDDYDLVQSWFEDSEAVRQILMNAITPRSREAAFWRHLETRRDWWARVIAKAAAVLKAGVGDVREDWTAFAATALALAKGRPLRKVPIMSSIVVESLAGSEDPWAAFPDDQDEAGQGTPEEAGTPANIPRPAPERTGELKRVLKAASMEITPEWVDGYLAAIIVAPKLAAPSGWLGGLLDQRHNFASHDKLQRFLDIVVMRYNDANTELADPAMTRARIAAYDVDGLRQWAEGFTESVARNKREWTGRTMNRDDRKILKLIADAADDRAGDSELGPLLPGWLIRRYALRH